MHNVSNGSQTLSTCFDQMNFVNAKYMNLVPRIRINYDQFQFDDKLNVLQLNNKIESQIDE